MKTLCARCKQIHEPFDCVNWRVVHLPTATKLSQAESLRLDALARGLRRWSSLQTFNAVHMPQAAIDRRLSELCKALRPYGPFRLGGPVDLTRYWSQS